MLPDPVGSRRRRDPLSLFGVQIDIHAGSGLIMDAVPGIGMAEKWYGGEVVKFKPLLDRWKKDAAPLLAAEEYSIRLPLDDAARLHALLALFPGRQMEEIITDLLHAGLDEIAVAMPYERGPKVISRDDHGDPLYEDVGLTPRFVELTRQFRKSLAAQANKPT